MNYSKHHDRLIERARARKLGGYTERHHVLPRCIGGDDSPENIVRLTPEEHYVVHQLLVKMHPGNYRLAWAAANMTRKTRKMTGRKNKLYGWLRQSLSAVQRAKMQGVKRGPQSPEHRAKIGAANSRVKTGKKRGPHSAKHRANMVAAIKAVFATKKSLRGIAPTSTIYCWQCSQPFAAKEPWHGAPPRKYCSSACRSRAHRKPRTPEQRLARNELDRARRANLSRLAMGQN